MIDFSLADALEDLQNTDALVIPNEIDVGGATAAEVNAALNAAIDSITHSSASITEEEKFDTIRSLLKHAPQLQGTTLNKLIDCLCSGLKAEIDATHEDLHPSEHAEYRAHKTALEAYTFLIRWFVAVAEKGGSENPDAPRPPSPKKRGKTAAKSKAPAKSKAATKQRSDEWSWAHAIPDTLGSLGRILSRIRTERIWQTTSERDAFLTCIVASASQVVESEVYIKVVEIRQQVYKIFCLAAKNHGQAFSVQTSITQNLQYFEHLSEPMAELVSMLAKEFDYAQCGEELLRTIANKSFADKGPDSKAESKDSKSFARFIVKLGELCPRLALKQISLLQRQLDSESYQIRNSIVELVGILIKDISNESPVANENEGLGVNGMGEELDRQRTQANQIQAFFDLLFERFLDLNSHVRSKTITTLIKLMDLKTKFPATRLRLTRLAIRSLGDKSSIVRKNCIVLLVKMIETHPYGMMHGGDLNAIEWQARFEKILAELEPLERALKEAADRAFGDNEEEVAPASVNESQDNAEAPQQGEKEGEDGDSSDKEHEADVEYNANNDVLGILADDDLLNRLDHDKLSKLQLIKRYYVDARTFIQLLESGFKEDEEDDNTRGALDKITELLNSTTKSEVLEAMNFLTTAKRYNMAAADRGVKAMLHLVWSKENSTQEDGVAIRGVRDRLVECYKTLYFEPLADLTPKENVDRIANNLIEMTHGATLAELTSLEELLSILMKDEPTDKTPKNEAIHPDIINRLWSVYSTDKNIPRAQRRGAIMILGMLAIHKPDIISDRLDALLSIGLGSLGRVGLVGLSVYADIEQRDLLLAKYTCLALRRIGGSHKKVKGSLADQNVRLPMDNPIFQRLRDLLECTTTSKEWFGMAEQAINTIYILGDQPDALCSAILQAMTTKAFAGDAAKNPEITQDATMVDETQETQDTQKPQQDSTETPPSIMVNAFQIAQMIFVAGHYAIKQLIHLELVEREYKRRKGDAAKTANIPKSTDELDQVAGSVEDDIADMITEARERELLYGPDSLLSIFGPMTVQICQFPRIYHNNTLRMAAVLSLCKFMCVSARFCEDHLMFLFKIFESTSEPVIKSNIAIAMGDIAIAFSTIMDDNSDRLYAGLSSTDLNVKKNTLMVLTHLILNGMIKVKGQLGEMAKRLEDEERRVRDLAKLFFKELSQKDNAIYNHLPDIVSSLSAGAAPVNEEMFEQIMQQIFKYIDKEKQAEAIVEKLCQRFKVAAEVNETDSAEDRMDADKRRWRDIALCLSMLPYKSERSLKKIVDGLPLYQDKLFEPTVFKRFQEILSKAKALAKGKEDSLGGLLQEFERALEEHRERGEENAALEKKVEKKRRQAKKKRATRREATPESE